MDKQELITIKQAEALTGWSAQTIRRAYEKGKLDKRLKSGVVYLDKQQVIQVLGMNTQGKQMDNQPDQPAPIQPPDQHTHLITQDNQVVNQVVDALAAQLTEKDMQIRQLHTLSNQQNIIIANLTKQLKQVSKQPKQLAAPVNKRRWWEVWK